MSVLIAALGYLQLLLAGLFLGSGSTMLGGAYLAAGAATIGLCVIIEEPGK